MSELNRLRFVVLLSNRYIISGMALTLAVVVARIDYTCGLYIAIISTILIIVKNFVRQPPAEQQPNHGQSEATPSRLHDIDERATLKDVSSRPSRKPIMQAKFAMAAESASDGFKSPRWDPTYFFLCGFLVNPLVLQEVLKLEYLPELQKAKLSGWTTRESGNSPALVRGKGSTTGIAYEVQTKEQFEYLKTYLGECYDWAFCDIQIEGEEEVRYGRTFRWKDKVSVGGSRDR